MRPSKHTTHPTAVRDRLGLDDIEVEAIRAMVRGNANEAMQKEVINILVYKICALGAVSFDPFKADYGRTAFYEGRRSIARDLLDLLNREE